MSDVAIRPVPSPAYDRTPNTPANALGQLLRSEAAVILAMLVSLGIFYFVPSLPVRLIGGLAFFALTLYRIDVSLAMVALTAPLLYRFYPIGRLYFSLAEFIILCATAAWLVRDGLTLARTRRLPAVMAMLRQPAVRLSLLFGVIGTVWLLVPPAALRQFALREFRVTVFEPVLFFLLIVRWLHTERDVWRTVGAWLVGAAIIGYIGVEQFLFGTAWNMEGVNRVSSVYPSATAFGIYEGRALALGIVLVYFLPAIWHRWRVAAGLLSSVMALGVLFSFARGAWVGVFVALVAVALLTRRRTLVVSLVGVMAAALVALIPLTFFNVERITSIFNLGSASNTGVARGVIWSAALRIIRDHPILGIGQDQFLYQDKSYGVPQSRLFTTSHPHNWILDFWLRLGLPGLLWMLAALTYFFRQCFQLWKRYANTALGALSLGLFASMVDFAVHGLLDMAYFTMDLALTFWLTMGLMALLTRGVAGDEASAGVTGNFES